jgi:ADP-heptose:LPS heptosyltransferase
MLPASIPSHVLADADRVLFLTHLALGDFTYLQTYFVALRRMLPHLHIDLWVDDGRRAQPPWTRDRNLGNYALYGWLESCQLFRHIDRVYSRRTFRRSLKHARDQRYPIVVSLGLTARAPQFVRWARAIAPDGFTAGVALPCRWYQLRARRAFGRLDAAIHLDPARDFAGKHITDVYASLFQRLFGVWVPPSDRAPTLSIPPRWLAEARTRFSEYGVDWARRAATSVVFVNPFAKSAARSWPLVRAAELIRGLAKHFGDREVLFLLNSVPEMVGPLRRFLRGVGLEHVRLFSADENFYQLPAMISLCDLVITVDTAVSHLASALRVPAVVLMGNGNPEWRPWDRSTSVVVTGSTVKAITVEQVLQTCAAERPSSDAPSLQSRPA